MMICVNPEITAFESMELVITVGSITIRISVIYRMPSLKSKNGLNQVNICNKFNDYLEKLSCMNGNIVIVGDFNIDWLKTNRSERKQFCNILTLNWFKIYIQKHPQSHHLLDYIITRKYFNIISDFLVSDSISDHRVHMFRIYRIQGASTHPRRFFMFLFVKFNFFYVILFVLYPLICL